MTRERLYLFDTTLRDGAPFFFLPPCGGGLGRGVCRKESVREFTPLPTALCAVDLPRKGGGKERLRPR